MTALPGLRPTAPTDRLQRMRGLQLAFVAAVVSGVAVYVNGQALSRFPSATVYTTGKNLVAGFVLVGIAIGVVLRSVSSESGPPSSDGASFGNSVGQREALALAAVALIGGAVPFVLFFEGLARATSADAAFIHKTLVVWVAILATVVLREKVTFVHVGAVALLVVAQIVVAEGIGSLRPGIGEAMILAATMCWSVELIVVKQLVASVHPAIVGASRIGGGAVLLVLWLAVTGRLQSFTSLSSSQWAWLVLTGSILSIFVSVWFAAVARAQVVDVAAILVFGAVVTGAIDVAAGGVVVQTAVLGWVLIVVAVGALAVRQFMDSRARVPA